MLGPGAEIREVWPISPTKGIGANASPAYAAKSSDVPCSQTLDEAVNIPEHPKITYFLAVEREGRRAIPPHVAPRWGNAK
jgi:hypothetical protein